MTAHPGPARAAAPQASAGEPHRPLHSQTGARSGSIPGDQEIPWSRRPGWTGSPGGLADVWRAHQPERPALAARIDDRLPGR